MLDFCYKDVFDMNTLVPFQMLFSPFQVNSHNNAYTGNRMILKNILHNIPDSLPGELCEVIQTGNGVKIERIVSKGHASPEGFWYDQESHEWVLLLKGGATLLFEGKQNPIVLGPGDYLNIPAHTRHRVEWTDLNQETVWLAIYY